METVSLTEAILFCILLASIYKGFVLTVVVFKVKDHDDNFTRMMQNVQSALGQMSDNRDEENRELTKDELKFFTHPDKGPLKLRDVKRPTD